MARHIWIYYVYYTAGGCEDIRSSLRLNLPTKVADEVGVRKVGDNQYSVFTTCRSDAELLGEMLSKHPQFSLLP